MKDTEIEKLVSDKVQSELKKIITKYRNYFLGFIGGVLIILTMGGVLSKGQVIVALHNAAFPPPNISTEDTTQICISYEGNVELLGNDPNAQSGKLSFYADHGQKVEVYAKVIHNLLSESDIRRKIFVAVDSKNLYDVPKEELPDRFFPITNRLNWDPLEALPNIHDIAFSLDDTQPFDLTDEVHIICVVLVYGKSS